tara:strand:- start:2500 stop:3417 length:918 start_codon:yes stop_codon:yes gene_type:complete
MLFIKQLLLTTDLTSKQANRYSTACISTSRPIYLVFGENSDHPEYVIRKLDSSNDFHSNQIHNKLYQLVGNIVPEPVGIYEYSGQKYDVQRGVQGSPWFQIKSRYRTNTTQQHIEERMWKTLNEFHERTCIKGDSSIKAGFLQPHKELHQALLGYKSTGETLTNEIEDLVSKAINDLSKIQDCSSIPQHGDFCLNNLIIDSSHITVIDFEDYSITTMPMYDHFTLALSLPSLGDKPLNASKVFKQKHLIDAAKYLGIPSEVIKWHFLHHLLLRLGPWSTGEKRMSYRTWLKQVLDSFVSGEKNKN